MVFFSPLWCAAFLTAMTVMTLRSSQGAGGGAGGAGGGEGERGDNGGTERSGAAAAVGRTSAAAAAVGPRRYIDTTTRRLKEEWGPLYAGNLLVWIPANGVVYGLTPVEHRVAAFSAINIVYTAVLSMWAERERGRRGREMKTERHASAAAAGRVHVQPRDD